MTQHTDPLSLDRAELRAMSQDPAGRALLDAAAQEIERRVIELRRQADEGEQLAQALRAGLRRSTQ